MKRFSIVGLILILSSCASTPQLQPVNLVDKTLIDYPEKGVTVSATLGERLVAKGYKSDGPAIEIKEGVLENSTFGNCAVSNQTLQSKFISRTNPSNGDICAGPFFMTTTLDSGETNWNCPGEVFNAYICYNKEDDRFSREKSKKKNPMYKDLVRIVRKQVSSSTNFVQELIYNGRVDNNIKFIYREFSEDMMRPAFNQTVQYDFNESKLISFKGLTLEIIEANNLLIKYRLISNF